MFAQLSVLILVSLAGFSCDRQKPQTVPGPTSKPAPNEQVKGVVSSVISPTSKPAPSEQVKGVVSSVIWWTGGPNDGSSGTLVLSLDGQSNSVYLIPSDAQSLRRVVGQLPPAGQSAALDKAFVGRFVEMRCEKQPAAQGETQTLLVVGITVGGAASRAAEEPANALDGSASRR
jgi:hypothetical protein